MYVYMHIDIIDIESIVYSIFGYYISGYINYNELTTSSLEIIVSKGNHPQVALIQVRELL